MANKENVDPVLRQAVTGKTEPATGHATVKTIQKRANTDDRTPGQFDAHQTGPITGSVNRPAKKVEQAVFKPVIPVRRAKKDKDVMFEPLVVDLTTEDDGDAVGSSGSITIRSELVMEETLHYSF